LRNLEIGFGEEINLLCGGGEGEKEAAERDRETCPSAQLWNAWFVRRENVHLGFLKSKERCRLTMMLR